MLHSWWVEGEKSDSDDKEISKRQNGLGKEKETGVKSEDRRNVEQGSF